MISPSRLFTLLKVNLINSRVSEFEALTHEDLRAESDHDLARRSVIGVFSYFLPWVIIYFSVGIQQSNSTLLEFLGFMLAAASVGRLYLALNFNRMYAANVQLWRWLFSMEAVFSSAVWGGVCAVALNDYGMGITTAMVMLSTVVIAAWGIVSLAPAARLGGIFVVLVFLPIVPYLLSSNDASQKGIGFLLLTIFLLMYLMWYRLHDEYWRSLTLRAELRRAKAAAEEVNIAKGLFIANVSHELRTPLTSVIGALGMINSYLSDDISFQAKTLVNMAYQNGKRLSVLIDDILDFEKLNANRMEFNYEPLLLTPFLTHAIELNRVFAETYKVTFTLAPPTCESMIIADEHRLMQVMTNLLSNAAKHSPPGEEVIIYIDKIGNKVRVAVKNAGEGVPLSFRPHIFQKFAQADNSSLRKNNGTGLGLAISKAIIDKMGGEIGFTSEVGQGATFYFDLPLASINPHLE